MTNSAHETSNKFLISAKRYAQLYKLGERNSGTSSVYTVDPDDSGAFEGTILYDTLKHKQQLSKFIRHNQFDANQHTLVKWCGFFFSNEKNGFTKAFFADANTSIYLPLSMSSIRQSVGVTNVNPTMMLPPLDHNQYVEADKGQLCSKASFYNFLCTNQLLKFQAFPKAIWQHVK